MSIREVTGDLFEQDVQAIGHGVNCRGVMGSGIAPLFKRRYPGMFDEYKALCDSKTLVPGLVMPWVAPTKVIYNMATQDRPGPDARIYAVGWCLRTVRLHAEQHRIKTIALPRIGAGIGGLEWAEVRLEMWRVFSTSPVELTIVSLPGA